MLDIDLIIDNGHSLDIEIEDQSELNIGLTSDTVESFARDYRDLSSKPTIDGVELVGNKKLSDFGLGIVTNKAILDLFK